MKRIVLGVSLMAAVALALNACDDKRDTDVTYETNNMVVHEDTDECPRADGQPCK